MRFLLLFFLLLPGFGFSQITDEQKINSVAINQVINDYKKARETGDSVLLKSIFTEDIDQLVSSGEWRNGATEAISGMVKSSVNNPGSRVLKVEKIKFLSSEVAMVDARYLIDQADGTQRKLWSSFILVKKKGKWLISAIRNMDPRD
ncbi:MAG TPA: DUF4440 domain-containing protein [Algoriphagus sp.]|jgi:uncharacterized protein (TIGR02246 family)|uniref:SgcJ/EcaC family oxidoreductase n=1 Tax=Algoriphagus TaxID=246875 RepID=UPI000C67DA19|nr:MULTISPECIES: SgcJ/EcaC family oxidoreductase [Algoriphagus]MAL13834.1 DUF4440 domain-containing protein [Algoriphagus sp.]MAN87523.1 DUF4440 domain-containing protein [Algoriphagus sp.]HAD53129.1 DUF4440 domain-containing protein [Algoriphagus sp.]HAH37088.1 DUF4440 domain-containing protein [Algoriphagus sp.]HAS58549.1 DUF4440 domain-containing protein [Algoriphagus sp.]|tara:strand:+ start:662 stop:1102 length:441 start_codon:yes stop_codon:yes gene_type:complete